MENQNEKSLQTNNPETNENNSNQTILGLKRERESDDQNKNLSSDFKKKKSEEQTNQPTEIKSTGAPIQQTNLISPQQYHQPNYNVYASNQTMMPHHVPMQGVYGYPPQPPLYYYNQTAIPSAIPGKNQFYFFVFDEIFSIYFEDD